MLRWDLNRNHVPKRRELRRKSMTRKEELIDELLKDYKTPEDLIGKDGIVKQLQKGLIERSMQAESTHHLGYEKHNPNGNGNKTINSYFAPLSSTSCIFLKTPSAFVDIDRKTRQFDYPFLIRFQRF